MFSSWFQKLGVSRRQVPAARLYLQLTQKNRESLDALKDILESWHIECGRIHNPSHRVDPNYWRFFNKSQIPSGLYGSCGVLAPQKASADACQDEDIVHASWRHGDTVNKVAVPEGAAGSPPF
jgi:hypothetical protein